MSKINTAIIAASVKIQKMGSDEKESMLLSILGSHPSIMFKALGIVVGKTVDPNAKYKVAIMNRNGSTNKINVIKTFREMVGAGLADAKNWSEGKDFPPYNGAEPLPSGVFFHHMSAGDAETMLRRVNASLAGSGVKAEIVPDDTVVPKLPVGWSY